ncbi:MAG: hypothetical protein V4689_18110 [Verrucomicrobiota bacterium]
MKRFFSALLVFLPTVGGLLEILWLFGDHKPSKHGPEFDQNLWNTALAGVVMAVVTLWLWLNTFFKLAKTPVIDGLLAALVPLCVTIQIYLTNRLDNFQYSGDDGWFMPLQLMISDFLFTLFSMGFALILSERYSKKIGAEEKDGPAVS